MHFQHLHGSQYFLGQLPIWASSLILYVLMIGIIPVGRYVFDGYFYNVAWSSKLGDVFLIGCIAIGKSILQEQGVKTEAFTTTGYHLALAVVSVTIGILVQMNLKQKRVMDRYHALFVVPVFLYFGLSVVVPLNFMQGTAFQKWLTVALALAWLALVAFDGITGRLDQEAWLRKKGIKLSEF